MSLPFPQDDGERSSFPLYTEAVKFINHRDGMVRAAVRTLTLNVYSIRDPAVQAFVVSKPASNYFNELAIFVAEQCQVGSAPWLMKLRLSSILRCPKARALPGTWEHHYIQAKRALLELWGAQARIMLVFLHRIVPKQ